MKAIVCFAVMNQNKKTEVTSSPVVLIGDSKDPLTLDMTTYEEEPENLRAQLHGEVDKLIDAALANVDEEATQF